MVHKEENEINDNIFNASYIKYPKLNFIFIASQNPIENNIYFFWKMIFYNNANKLIKLNNNNSRDYINENNLKIDDITINFLNKEIKTIYIKRKYEIFFNGNKKLITHYQFNFWEDNKDPDYDLEELKKFFKKLSKNKLKILVHCNAGIGRTGTFISLFFIYFLIRIRNIKNISIFKIVRILREQRWNMVFSIEQYKYLYKFLKSLTS